MKKEIELKIKEHPIVTERKEKRETIKHEKINKINERLQRKQSKKEAKQKRITKKQTKQKPASEEKLYLQFIPPHDNQVHDEIIISMLTNIRNRYANQSLGFNFENKDYKDISSVFSNKIVHYQDITDNLKKIYESQV